MSTVRVSGSRHRLHRHPSIAHRFPVGAPHGQFRPTWNAVLPQASTVYFFFHAHLVSRRYRTALCISGLVTLIAFYHYVRIFNSFVEAYEFVPVTEASTEYAVTASGQPFNDAYRYMDWLLTVPLLLIELLLVMDLDKVRIRRVFHSLVPSLGSGLRMVFSLTPVAVRSRRKPRSL